MHTKTVELKYAIPVPTENGGTVEVKRLTLTRLKAKHLKKLPEDFMEKGGSITPVDVVPILAALTGLQDSTIDELDLEDLVNVAEELTNFLEACLQIGKS